MLGRIRVQYSAPARVQEDDAKSVQTFLDLLAVEVAAVGNDVELVGAKRLSCCLGHRRELRAIVADVGHLVRRSRASRGCVMPSSPSRVRID